MPPTAGRPRVLLVTDAPMDGPMEEHAAPGHPERPERLGAVAHGVEQGARLADAELRREEAMTAEEADLLRIHSTRYVELLDRVCTEGGGWVDADTYLAPRSMAAARRAAGATIRCATAVLRREAAVAFAVVRPPGHHAAGERAAGFCLVNNVAVAVEHIRIAALAHRVAVLDWDVHHGDGTQEIFDADPDLCYASTHQMPLYPGTGYASERGSGHARGTKHNVPLIPGSGDEAFVEAWLHDLLPEVEAFHPEAILVSAGYDAHAADPLAHLEVTADGYRSVARGIGAVARRLSIPGVALALEGGYDLPALTSSSAATVVGLLEGLGLAERADDDGDDGPVGDRPE